MFNFEYSSNLNIKHLIFTIRRQALLLNLLLLNMAVGSNPFLKKGNRFFDRGILKRSDPRYICYCKKGNK